LKDVTAGDELKIEARDGSETVYRVTQMRIAHESEMLTLDQDRFGRELILVTCYPFDALAPGGPLRYVVTARPSFSL